MREPWRRDEGAMAKGRSHGEGEGAMAKGREPW